MSLCSPGGVSRWQGLIWGSLQGLQSAKEAVASLQALSLSVLLSSTSDKGLRVRTLCDVVHLDFAKKVMAFPKLGNPT